MTNIDQRTVEGFGEEWETFNQTALDPKEKSSIFADYFGIFPWKALPEHPIGADIGCGSGRWASLVAPNAAKLFAIDPSAKALQVAKRNLREASNVEFLEAGVANIPLPDASLDFAYSLGVLHHVPETETALQSIAKKLKGGAPFLVYLYYSFEQSPLWFRLIWGISDFARRIICRLPFPARKAICNVLATTLYLPLARGAHVWEKIAGKVPSSWPLAYYRDKSFYVMRNDALDRFGTRLEQRFSRKEISGMLSRSGFERVEFSPSKPYWTALCYRSRE